MKVKCNFDFKQQMYSYMEEPGRKEFLITPRCCREYHLYTIQLLRAFLCFDCVEDEATLDLRSNCLTILRNPKIK